MVQQVFNVPILLPGDPVEGLQAATKQYVDDSQVTIGSTVLKRGDFTNVLAGLDTVSANTFTGNLTGTASKATKLAQAFTFNLTGDVTGTATVDGSQTVSLQTTLSDITPESSNWADAITFTISGDASGSVDVDGSSDVTLSLSVANAAKAAKWSTARTVTLTGPIAGSVSLDGSKNVTLTTSIGNNQLQMGMVNGLSSALAGKVAQGTAFADAFSTAATYHATSEGFDLNTAVAGSKHRVVTSGNLNVPTGSDTVWYVETIAYSDTRALQRAIGMDTGTVQVRICNSAGTWGDWVSTYNSQNLSDLTLSGDTTLVGDLLPDQDNVRSLGSPSLMWKDVYIGPGSLYVNGQKVIENSDDTIKLTADPGQNISIQTQGPGDLELKPLGTGLIRLRGTTMFEAGTLIRSTDGSALQFDDDITFSAATGIVGGLTVDGYDVYHEGNFTPSDYILKSQIGVANGIVPLGADKLIPDVYLPSYVDDVIDVADEASLPTTGEKGKIYVTDDKNEIYRWSGSKYILINSSVGSSDTAVKLATARTIGLSGVTATGALFDGSQDVNITITAIPASLIKSGTLGVGRSWALTGDITKAAGTSTTVIADGVVTNSKLKNASITLGNQSVALGSSLTSLTGLSSVAATTFTGALTGNASTATTLKVARTINGVSFDGSQNITIKAEATSGHADTADSATSATSAGSANTLSTARNFSLSGVITSNTKSFDGSGNVVLTTSVADGAFSIAKISGLQAALDSKLDIVTTAIGSSADLNSYTETGLYYQHTNASADSGTNYPEAQAGLLEVVYANEKTHQRYTVYNSGRCYYRCLYDGVWSAWVQLARTEDNVASATKLNTARTINGVAFDGSKNITITASAAGGHADSADTATNASTATTLKTARGFKLSGIVSSNTVSFDGSNAVTLTTSIADGALSTAKVAGLQPVLNNVNHSSTVPTDGASTTFPAAPGGIGLGSVGQGWSGYVTNYGTVMSVSMGVGRQYQTMFPNNEAPELPAFRTLYNNAWSPWRTFWHSGNLNPTDFALAANTIQAGDPRGSILVPSEPQTLLPGSTAWQGIRGPDGAHCVIKLYSNDNNDSFAIAASSTSNTTDEPDTLVFRVDSIGNTTVAGTLTATSFSGALSGNASSATKLAVARTINGVAFDGTKNIALKYSDLTGVPENAIPLGSAENLNNFTTPGVYTQSTNASAAAGTNYPYPQAGVLEVSAIASDGHMVWQRYTTYNGSTRIYIRNYYQSWGSWVQVWGSNTQLDIGTSAASARSALGLSNSATINASTSGSSGSTLAQRDSSGDLWCRLLRPLYASTNGSVNYFMTQVEIGSGNNYIRPSTPTQAWSALKGFADNTYLPKSGGTMSGTITFDYTGNDKIYLSPGAEALECSSGNIGIYDHSGAGWTFRLTRGSGGTCSIYKPLIVSGDVSASDFAISSDRRLKKGITSRTPRTRLSDRLRFVDFTWRDSNADDVGLIAQEVQKQAPEYVRKRDDGKLSVSYGKLSLECVLELAARVKTLEAQLAEAKTQTPTKKKSGWVTRLFRRWTKRT